VTRRAAGTRRVVKNSRVSAVLELRDTHLGGQGCSTTAATSKGHMAKLPRTVSHPRTEASRHADRAWVSSVSLAGAACLLAALSACGQPAGQFFVVQNQSPEAGCTIPTGAAGTYQGEGTLDIRVPASSDAAYMLFPLLENDLPAAGSGGAEPNRIALSSFEVEIAFVDGNAAAAAAFAAIEADSSTAGLMHFQTPWSGSVAPGGGRTSAGTSAFPAETAIRLRDSGALADHSYARVTANVRAHGSTQSGSITSDVFKYPIRVCDGCLINSITSCPSTTAVLTGGVCGPGQDAPVDCCTQGTSLICPATMAAPTTK